MTSLIPASSLVHGASLDLKWHSDNPALDERFEHYFFDGWYEIIIKIDGTHPCYAQKGCWRNCVVWTKGGGSLKILTSDNSSFLQLKPGEEVRGISITEEALTSTSGSEVFGLWKNTLYLDQKKKYARHAALLQSFTGSRTVM